MGIIKIKFGRKSGGCAFLRQFYTKHARKEHLCDNCYHYIMPGESYTGEVIRLGRVIVVIKNHLKCPVDPLKEEREVLGEMDEPISSGKQVA